MGAGGGGTIQEIKPIYFQRYKHYFVNDHFRQKWKVHKKLNNLNAFKTFKSNVVTCRKVWNFLGYKVNTISLEDRFRPEFKSVICPEPTISIQ